MLALRQLLILKVSQASEATQSRAQLGLSLLRECK